MKALIACVLALGGALLVAGCGAEAKATDEDKKNIERLTNQGMTPQSSNQGAQPQPGVPLSGQVDPP